MSDRKRIIFVDDETSILSGLTRMLRSMRQEWETLCFDSAVEVLAALSAHGADVVVSDMRMPGMTGLHLFRQMRKSCPGVVRIALSGQMSRDKVLQSIGLVHQYLAKPSDAETVKATLSHVFALGPMILIFPMAIIVLIISFSQIYP